MGPFQLFSTLLAFSLVKNDAKRTGKLITSNTQKKTKSTNEIYRWITDEWGSCSKTCGAGMKERAVLCIEESNGLRNKVRKRTNTQNYLLSFILSVAHCIAFVCCWCFTDGDADAVVCNGKSSVLLS